MTGPTFKDRIFGELAVLGRALANPHRLELLDLLAQGERTVEDLARESRMSVANTSAHLQVLRRARMVEAEKHGLYVRYRLAGSGIFELWRPSWTPSTTATTGPSGGIWASVSRRKQSVRRS